jgi:DMSO/TMAO reductase YedYZ molybdopterin-dependent catalytic subunit
LHGVQGERVVDLRFDERFDCPVFLLPVGSENNTIQGHINLIPKPIPNIIQAKNFTGARDDSDGGQCGMAKWTGVKMRDVFKSLGFDSAKMRELEDAGINYHVILTGEDGYEVSIPLATAARADRDVMIVTKMNGESLPRDHG